jgi:MFS family permease
MYRIWNIYALAAFGTIGGALFGFDVSSMSAWIANESYLEFFGHPDSTTQGGITASMSGGSLVGALIAGWIADKWGRRGALMVASIVFIIGSVLQCSAQNVGHLIGGRVVSGFAIGITSSQVIVYLSELAPASKRGSIVGIQQWAIEWGILIMYLISYACSVTIHSPRAFRIAWGIQAIPAAILLVAVFFFPESPRWLANHDRWEEALHVLANLHAKGNRDDPVVIAEFDEVKEAVRVAQESKDIGYLGLFGPKVWKQTVVGVSVQIWQQLLGGNIMLYYLVYIFQMAGLVRLCSSFAHPSLANSIRRAATSPLRLQSSNTSSSSSLPALFFSSSTASAAVGCSWAVPFSAASSTLRLVLSWLLTDMLLTVSTETIT